MGLRSTSDKFCAKSDKAIISIPNTQKIVDVILICDLNYPTLFKCIGKVLSNCRELKITISRKKLEVGEMIDFPG